MCGGAGRIGHVTCSVLDGSLFPIEWLVTATTFTLMVRPNKKIKCLNLVNLTNTTKMRERVPDLQSLVPCTIIILELVADLFEPKFYSPTQNNFGLKNFATCEHSLNLISNLICRRMFFWKWKITALFVLYQNLIVALAFPD